MDSAVSATDEAAVPAMDPAAVPGEDKARWRTGALKRAQTFMDAELESQSLNVEPDESQRFD